MPLNLYNILIIKKNKKTMKNKNLLNKLNLLKNNGAIVPIEGEFLKSIKGGKIVGCGSKCGTNCGANCGTNCPTE